MNKIMDDMSINQSLIDMGYNLVNVNTYSCLEHNYEHKSGNAGLKVDYVHKTFLLFNCNPHLEESLFLDLVDMKSVEAFIEMIGNLDLSIFDEPREFLTKCGFKETCY